MKITSTLLDNGIEHYHVKVPSNTMTMVASVNAGPIFERKERSGISHFIEHIIANGSLNYPERSGVEKELDKIGGLNKFETGKWNTTFTGTTLVNDFESLVDIVSDGYLRPLFNEEIIEKERGVVLDEIRCDEDCTETQIWKKLENMMYRNRPISKPILGTKQLVSNFTRRQLLANHKRIYCTSNIKIFTAGDLTTRETNRLIKKHFKSENEGRELTFKSYQYNPRSQKQGFFHRGDFNNSYLLMGREVMCYSDKTYPALEMLRAILHERVFNSLLGKGLSYNQDVHGYFSKHRGEFIIEASCHNENTQIVSNELKGIFSDLSHGNIRQEELDSAKNTFVKNHILSNQGTYRICELVANNYDCGDVDLSFREPKLIKEVSLHKVKRYAKHFLRWEDWSKVRTR
jgi:predicted Zn-dependent peptidase